jgi:deazaflavin-dependent oxidoreductase (nitroreductase family)
MSIKQHPRELVVVVFALAFTRTPWLIRMLNPLVCWLLVTGLPMGPNALLTVRGRGTGRPRSSPVAFLDFGEKGFLQAASNKVNWVRNVRASGEAVIRRGRTSKTFEVTELPPETAGRVLHDLLAPFPRSRLIAAEAGEDRPPVAVLHYFRLRVDDALEDYIRVARRQPVFELRRNIPMPSA